MYRINTFNIRTDTCSNSVDQDQTPQNTASEQGIHCLTPTLQFKGNQMDTELSRSMLWHQYVTITKTRLFKYTENFTTIK